MVYSGIYFLNPFEEYKNIKEYNIEPEHIFMLMFSEVINQSIKSEAGSGYKNRIFDVLISIGIDKNSIKKNS